MARLTGARVEIDPCAGVEAEITLLESLDREGLRARWRMRTGRAAPAHLGQGLLFRILAYRVQAERFGDLDRETVRFLDRIAGEGARFSGVPLPDAEIVRPGTLLSREWQGVTYRVMSVAGGYAWEGTTYRSLSEVARAITGSRRNGPRFFGLRGAGSQDSGKSLR